jgi:YVTN family beta-propeller protein
VYFSNEEDGMCYLKRACAIICAALLLFARASVSQPIYNPPPPDPFDLPWPNDPPDPFTDPFDPAGLPDPIDFPDPWEDPIDPPDFDIPLPPDPWDIPDPFPDVPSLLPDPFDHFSALSGVASSAGPLGASFNARAVTPPVFSLMPFPMRLAFPPARIPNGPTASPTKRTCNALSATLLVVADTNKNTVDFVSTCPWAITNRVPVGTAPVGATFTPDGKTVLVANSGSGSISFVDVASHTVTATLPLPAFNGDPAMPNNIIITSDASMAYVTDHDGNPGGLVYIVDLVKKAVVGQINVGAYPSGSALSPDGSQLWVNCRNDNVVNVIDTLTNTVIAGLRIASPTGIAFNPTGTRVYAASATGSTGDYIAVIDPSTFSVMTKIPTGNLPHVVMVTPTGRHLFVTNALSNSIMQIETNTNTVVRTVNMPNGLRHPLGLAFVH